MNVSHTHLVYLCQKLPYMLIRGFTIIFVKLSKIRHPKPTGIRNSIIVFGIGFLISSSTSLGRESKFPQRSRNLVPHSLGHPPFYPPGSCLVERIAHDPGKHDIGHWSMWHPIPHGRDVWPICDSLVKGLVQVRIIATARLTDIDHHTPTHPC
jgi:hypothetical protein